MRHPLLRALPTLRPCGIRCAVAGAFLVPNSATLSPNRALKQHPFQFRTEPEDARVYHGPAPRAHLVVGCWVVVLSVEIKMSGGIRAKG